MFFNFLKRPTCTIEDISSIRLGDFLDTDMDEGIEYFMTSRTYKSDKKEIKKNMSHFLSSFLYSKPTIASYVSFFDANIECAWEVYRGNHFLQYGNLSERIFSNLSFCESLDEVFSKLPFLNDMSIVLKEKFSLLKQSMDRYLDLIHKNNLEGDSTWTNLDFKEIEEVKNRIMSISRLYIALSKENYKKEKMKLCLEIIKPYFTLRKENPTVLDMRIKNKQKQEFKSLYISQEKEMMEYIDSLKERYFPYFCEEELLQFFDEFIVQDIKTTSILMEPLGYQRYLKYKKAVKLVHRLNSRYLSPSSSEVSNYQEFIEYDSFTEKYSCIDFKFTDSDILDFLEYEKKKRVLENITKDICKKRNSIVVTHDFEDGFYLDGISSFFPFNDTYFEFNSEAILSMFSLEDLKKNFFSKLDFSIFDSFTNQESYSYFYEMLIEHGLLWFYLFLDFSVDALPRRAVFGNFHNQLIYLINHISSVLELAEKFHIDSREYHHLLRVLKISQYASREALFILSEELISTLSQELGFTSRNPVKIIEVSEDLVSKMVTKNTFTVPRVEGEYSNYKYSLYDSLDLDFLLSGIKTSSCFRVNGNDNDFFHYCALDKNGFSIKIEDSCGNLVARSSGFRHGNCIFMNQLRSIYEADSSFPVSEKKNIVEVFQRACNDMISISQNNKEEIEKIEYVFAIRDYLLIDYPLNVSSQLSYQIGRYPMDTYSEDWIKFLKETPNLSHCTIGHGFLTDYGMTPLVLVASSKSEEIMREDIKFYDAPSLYKRKRGNIVMTDDIGLEDIQKINRIRAIYFKLMNQEFQPFQDFVSKFLVTGDNWYIVFDFNSILDGMYLLDDEYARCEFEEVSLLLRNELFSNSDMSLEDLSICFLNDNWMSGEKGVKIKKFEKK